MSTDVLMSARALVLHDLSARGMESARSVDVLEAVLSDRRWWVEQWPDGGPYVSGQVAQDVQEKLLDGQLGRWPLCTVCDQTDEHELRIEPELGADPHWVCELSGIVASPLGEL
ncbi:MAG TPA: hypothetical protein VFZ37_00250 [Jiangellaceae bacterium]